MSITHCIFDLDGLLLDTESIYTECLQQLCAPYGKNFSTETKLQMMGKSSLEAGQILIRMLEFLINIIFQI
jgi:pseudouridine-5'-monophosphatase